MIGRYVALLAVLMAAPGFAVAAPPVDATTMRGKVMTGYQGWFRCPGDGTNAGWVHWSRDPAKIAPESLTFEMWPDMSAYSARERYPAPGFSHRGGRQAELFSSDNGRTVLRHFEWMRDYGIDGAWLQHFLVDLPGGTQPQCYAFRRRVMEHVRVAAGRTGRVWAIAYDIAGMPSDRVYDTLTRDWARMVAEGVTKDPRYLHQNGKPVVLIWGFYYNNAHNPMTAEIGGKLIDYFAATGPQAAFLVGGGDWDWRRNPDPAWQGMYRRFRAYVPWNIGNYSIDAAGVKSASTGTWAEDRRECERRGAMWIPTVYPGFSWDNLTRKPAGSSLIPRRRGGFLWEQFHELAKLGVDTAYVAMFDEVDEGTAVFRVTSDPPTQGHFVGYEGMPSDWYLRLIREGVRMLRGARPITAAIPIRPAR